MGVMEGTAELNTGAKIPLIALGTGIATQEKEEEEIKMAVTTALQVGYRHIDTASVYGSEDAIGKALNEAFKNGLVKREEVFVTTKLWNTDHDDPVSALKTSLKKLDSEYVDLYLVHWPLKYKKEAWGRNPMEPLEDDFLPLDLKSTWQGMEKCVELGLAKAIGVSNFSPKKIEDLLSYANIPPAVDQVEMHPMWQQQKLREYCSNHNIHVSAWSPLGAPYMWSGPNEIMDNPVIHEIAQKHGKTRAQVFNLLSGFGMMLSFRGMGNGDDGVGMQVMLRWGIEEGVSVLPRSSSKARIAENFQILDWSLDAEDHEKISKFPQKKNLRFETFVNKTSSPYKTVEELWDEEV